VDPSGLIAILGFFVAVVAIIPREKRLDLRIRFSIFDLGVIIFCFALIHYIIYFEVFKKLGLTTELGSWQLGYNQNNIIYLIFLALSAFLIIRAKFSKIGPSNIHIANDLFEQLLFEEKYFEVGLLTERYIEDISSISKSQSLFNKLAKKILPITKFEAHFQLKKPSLLDKIFPKQRIWLSSILDHEDEISEVAGHMLQRLVSHAGFVRYLSISRPYLAIKIIKTNTYFSTTFVDNFIDGLLDHQEGIYYFELEHTTSTISNRYKLSKNNKFLYYLLSDVRISESLGIYQPIGDKVCSLIEYNKEIIEKYNQPLRTYYDKGRFKCPLDSSIHFFEIMILESMHQGIRWHMWLYYFPTFTKKILAKLNPSEEVDLEREWPTPFYYLLYQIVKVMLNWLEEYSHVENKQAIEIDNENLTHDNGSIPKSTTLALGNILYELVSSDSITNKFKVYIFEIVARHIRDLSHDPHQERLNRLLMKSIVYNGFHNQTNQKYIHQLRSIYEQIDHLLRFELEEFNELLNNAAI